MSHWALNLSTHKHGVLQCPATRSSSNNTVLVNLKTMLSGAFKTLQFRKYAHPYLDDFAYRFNHRFDLRSLIASLVVDVAKAKPLSKNDIRRGHAEVRF